MKVRYITEGYFKNPEQAKAARAKQSSLSNIDKVAGAANKIIIDRVNDVINAIIRERKLSPIDFSKLFSKTSTLNINGAFLGGIRSTKNECTCEISFDSERPTIILNFNFGKFTDRTARATVKSDVDGIILLVEDGYTPLYPGYLDKERLARVFDAKIKSAIKTKTLTTSSSGIDKQVYQFILNSDIKLGKMIMYDSSSGTDKDELTIYYPAMLMFCGKQSILGNNSRAYLRNEIGSNCKKVIDEMLELFDFKIPVKIYIPVLAVDDEAQPGTRYQSTTATVMTPISKVFSNCKTYKDIEDRAYPDGETRNLPPTKYLKDYSLHRGGTVYMTEHPRLYKRIIENLNNAEYISANYIMIYEGEYSSNTKFRIVNEIGPKVERIVISSDETSDTSSAKIVLIYSLCQDFNEYVSDKTNSRLNNTYTDRWEFVVDTMMWTNHPESWGQSYLSKNVDEHDLKLMKDLEKFIETAIN